MADGKEEKEAWDEKAEEADSTDSDDDATADTSNALTSVDSEADVLAGITLDDLDDMDLGSTNVNKSKQDGHDSEEEKSGGKKKGRRKIGSRLSKPEQHLLETRKNMLLWVKKQHKQRNNMGTFGRPPTRHKRTKVRRLKKRIVKNLLSVHGKPCPGSGCLQCSTTITQTNFVEFCRSGELRWRPAKLCLPCVQRLLETQWSIEWPLYIQRVNCARYLNVRRLLLKQGPPVWLRHDEGLPCKLQGAHGAVRRQHVERLNWTGQTISARLAGSLTPQEVEAWRETQVDMHKMCAVAGMQTWLGQQRRDVVAATRGSGLFGCDLSASSALPRTLPRTSSSSDLKSLKPPDDHPHDNLVSLMSSPTPSESTRAKDCKVPIMSKSRSKSVSGLSQMAAPLANVPRGLEKSVSSSSRRGHCRRVSRLIMPSGLHSPVRRHGNNEIEARTSRKSLSLPQAKSPSSRSPSGKREDWWKKNGADGTVLPPASPVTASAVPRSCFHLRATRRLRATLAKTVPTKARRCMSSLKSSLRASRRSVGREEANRLRQSESSRILRMGWLKAL